MRACLRDLAWTNRWTLAYRPQMHWLDTLADELSALAYPIRILDVACGYGAGLRKIEQWARKRGIAVELTGLELNRDATVIAEWATPASSRIRWVTADGVRHLLSENPVQYESVADGQRWLGAYGNRAIYAQIASHLWRDFLLYGVIPLQLARFRALIGAMFASATKRGW